MKKQLWADAAALLILLCLAFSFFARLFFPTPHIIATPDFGTNDAVFRSLATKVAYGRMIHQGTVPLWTTELESGYPLGADAIGTWFPLNLVLFRLFDPIPAYNLSLVLSVALIGIGMFWWMRVIGVSQLPAFFAGATLMLSGIIVPRLTHGMVIPSLSLLPWIMGATAWYAQKQERAAAIFFVLCVAVQLLANFPQASMLSIGFAWWYFVALVHAKDAAVRRILIFSAAILVAIGIAAIQLVPTWEYLQASLRSAGFDPDAAVQYSFHPKNFLMFLYPYSIGNPKYGTYPPYWQLYGSIFWENSGYVGIVPLLFAVFECVLLALRKTTRVRDSRSVFFIIALGVSLILMVGKFSPLYLVFTIPPLSLFRTPSRFLWIFVPSLIAIAALSFDRILVRFGRHPFVRSMVMVLIAVNTATLLYVWYPYHLIEPVSQWISPPKILRAVSGRIYSTGIPALHNEEFITHGWTRPDRYAFLQNGLQANESIFWHIPTVDVYGAVPLARASAYTNYLSAKIHPDTEKIATVSASTHIVLNMLGVHTILSPYTLMGSSLDKAGEETFASWKITAYRNMTPLPRARMVYRTEHVATFEEAFRIIERSDFDPATTALVEGDTPNKKPPPTIPTPMITESSGGDLTIGVLNNQTEGVLVVADSYYPGWRATIDGHETPVLPVNISQRGVIVPSGTHTIRMEYRPKSLVIGIVISIGSLLLLLIGVGFRGFFRVADTALRVGRPRSNRGSNRAR